MKLRNAHEDRKILFVFFCERKLSKNVLNRSYEDGDQTKMYCIASNGDNVHIIYKVIYLKQFFAQYQGLETQFKSRIQPKTNWIQLNTRIKLPLKWLYSALFKLNAVSPRYSFRRSLPTINSHLVSDFIYPIHNL